MCKSLLNTYEAKYNNEHSGCWTTLEKMFVFPGFCERISCFRWPYITLNMILIVRHLSSLWRNLRKVNIYQTLIIPPQSYDSSINKNAGVIWQQEAIIRLILWRALFVTVPALLLLILLRRARPLAARRHL